MQAYADLAVNLGQTAIMSTILQNELKRQRVRPENPVARDMLPYALLFSAVSLYSQDMTLGLTHEAQVTVFIALIAYLCNSIVMYRQASQVYQT